MKPTTRLVVGQCLRADHINTHTYATGEKRHVIFDRGAVSILEAMPLLMEHDRGWPLGRVVHVRQDPAGAIWAVSELDERISDLDTDGPWFYSAGGKIHFRRDTDLFAESGWWGWRELSLTSSPAGPLPPVTVARVSAFGWDGFGWGVSDHTRKLIGHACSARNLPLELNVEYPAASSRRSTPPDLSPSFDDPTIGELPVRRDPRTGEPVHVRYNGQVLSVR